MRKRVYRYFFDFKDGQEKWLNKMAAEGWRLKKCGQLTYVFENCTPNQYKYAVEFVADKAHSESKDYKAFLEDMGYKTFYKNIDVGIFVASTKWRPWAEVTGQLATAPGGLLKELIIVEKKNDGTPFELHTDLADLIAIYTRIRMAYFWTMGGMLSVVVMCLFFMLWVKSIYLVLCVVFGAAAVSVWLIPSLKISRALQALREEAETSEHDRQSVKKKTLTSIALLVVPALIISIVFGTMYFSGVELDSYSARGMVQTSWGNTWNATYKSLSGYRNRQASLDEGKHVFTVEITTKSGDLSLSITGQDGTEYYKESGLSTSSFQVQVDIPEKDKLLLRFDANKHSGGYKVNWE